MKCAIINGISKGFGYDVGDIHVSHLRDRWNAVYIDGWRLIHPLWAFKNVISYKTGKWVPRNTGEAMQLDDLVDDSVQMVKHDFNEYYFLVEPSELINVCLPDDAKWQMCSPKLTKDKWIGIPYLMKRYHMEGFKITSEFKSTMKSKNGVCTMTIHAPSNKDSDYQLAYDFYFNYAEGKADVYDVIHLKRHVLLSRDSVTKNWCLEARMPIPGLYRITVYGGPSTQTKLPWICDVAVKCNKSTKRIKSYPDCPNLGFGPMYMTEKAGLVEPSHSSGMLFVNPRQTYHLTFKLQRAVKVKATVVGEGVRDKDMEKWVKCTINNQSTLHVLDVEVQLHTEGEYAVKIFTKPKDAPVKATWENVCNYYMSTDHPRLNGAEFKGKGYKVGILTLMREYTFNLA